MTGVSWASGAWCRLILRTWMGLKLKKDEKTYKKSKKNSKKTTKKTFWRGD